MGNKDIFNTDGFKVRLLLANLKAEVQEELHPEEEPTNEELELCLAYESPDMSDNPSTFDEIA